MAMEKVLKEKLKELIPDRKSKISCRKKIKIVRREMKEIEVVRISAFDSMIQRNQIRSKNLIMMI